MENEDVIQEQEEAHCSYDSVELDLSGLYIDHIPADYIRGKNAKNPLSIVSLNLSNNKFALFPLAACYFRNITSVDMSNNELILIPNGIENLNRLTHMVLRNNQLEFLPQGFAKLTCLEVLNLSGNHFEQFPSQVLELTSLKQLYLGGNRLTSVPSTISSLLNLEILYLGGNKLKEVPSSIRHLNRLVSLALCDNCIWNIPASISDLRSLRSLSLHNNCIRVLPPGIARLRQLEHLSLRNNPLVTDFVNDIDLEPPSLKELAGRVLKIRLQSHDYSYLLPADLQKYLNSANRCVNPKCKGVYFESCSELVKFVDFCGKYRVPLLIYLCSTKCTSTDPAYAHSSCSESSEDEAQMPTSSRAKMKKILLG